MDLQRGKKNNADAIKIARYAFLHREELKLSRFQGKTMIKLQTLLSYRDRLMNAQKGFKIASGELSRFVEKENSSQI